MYLARAPTLNGAPPAPHRSCSAVSDFQTRVERSGCSVRRPLKAEMSSKRGRLVFLPEEAALLKHRDDAINERIKRTGKPRRHDVETVCGARLEPFLQLVGNTLCGTPNEAVSLRGAGVVP